MQNRRKHLLAIAAVLFSTSVLTPVAHAQGYENFPEFQQQGPTYNAPPGWPGDPSAYQANTRPRPQQQTMSQFLPAPPAQQAAGSSQQQAKIGQWFASYDQIRRTAQMSPQEKAYSDRVLSSKLSMFIPGPEKLAAQNLLGAMVARYDKASASLRALPSTPETLQLQKGYFQYFTTARSLFADYLKVQSNVLATDQAGNPIAATLLPRKQALEQLEGGVKQLDAQLRAQFGIRPYQY